MHELDYELTLVETIRDCVEDLEMETCSKMTPEVIVPNKGHNKITELERGDNHMLHNVCSTTNVPRGVIVTVLDSSAINRGFEPW
jgi:hypothetical protein